MEQQLQKDILGCLQELKGSGKFASIRTADFVFPGLEVNGIGEVSFPVNQLQANALIEVSHKAPFGKGSQTILDNDVRSAWEIDATKLNFNNPAWNKFLDRAIRNIKTDLGLEDYTVKANLYKLLIYEEGDFFLPHKDSEKEKGMFGTLIIGLPSQYSGGELIINFEGNQEVADFAQNNPNHSLNYAVFYADCDHEVKELTSGFRVCLVYNLIQQKQGKRIELESLQAHANKLATILTQNNSNSPGPHFILLGHQYTPENFSQQTLKLNDRAKTQALLLAADQAGYYAKMCLVTSYLIGVPEYDSYYNDNQESLEMGELIEEELYIEHWLEDDLPGLGHLSFEENNLIASFPLKDGEPLIKESSGYMGNYGPDVMHWYHYGAVMIWSPEANAKLLPTRNRNDQLSWIAYFSNLPQISDAEVLAVEDILRHGLNDQYVPYLQEHFDAVAHWIINKNDPVFLINLNRERLQFFFEKIRTYSWLRLLHFLPAQYVAILFEKIGTGVTLPVLEKLLEVLHAMSKTEELKSIAIEQTALLSKQFQDLYATNQRLINVTALSNLFVLAQDKPENE